MQDTILVNIVADHTFECATNIIGRAGEAGTARFEIILTENMSDCSAYLDFEKPNGEQLRSSKMNIVNNVITYNLPAYLLTESGELKVQLVLEKDNGIVWKSSVKKFTIIDGINGTDEIPIIKILEYDGTVIIS